MSLVRRFHDLTRLAGGLLLLAVVATSPLLYSATFDIESDANDGGLVFTPSTSTQSTVPTATDFRVGHGGAFPNRSNLNAVYFFELPAISSSPLLDAELSFPYVDLENSAPFDLDVWGLGYVASPTLNADWLHVGDNDPNPGLGITSRQKIQDDVIGLVPDPNAVAVLVTTDATGSVNLRSFLQSLYTQGAQPGDYAVIRLNDDRANSDPNFGGTGGYRVGFQEFGALTPTLALTAEADVDWIGGSGFGSYNDPGNWSAGAVPDASDTIRFNQTDAFVSFDPGVSPTVRGLEINGGDVSFIIPDDPASNEAITVLGDAVIRGGDLTFDNAASDAAVNLSVSNNLVVDGGSTLLVQDGGTLTTAGLFVAASDSGDGTVQIRSSTLAVSGSTTVGLNGHTGTLTLENATTGTFANINVGIAVHLTPSSNIGRMNVLSGATIESSSILVGAFSNLTSGGNQEGTLTVDGTGSTLTMTGASTLTVGDDVNPDIIADVVVSNGGELTTGTGLTLIRNSGNVTIVNATFNAGGDVVIDRGSLTSDALGVFNLAAGKKLTASNGAQVDLSISHSIDDGTQFEFNSGAEFMNVSSIGVTTDGTLVVDGDDSMISNPSSNGGVSAWGSGGGTADVTFRNDARGSLGGIDLADDAAAGTTGILRVESDARVTMNDLDIATSGGETTSGTVMVTADSSRLSQNGASTLTVGHGSEGSAEIHVDNNSFFSTGTGGITVNATGLIETSSNGVFDARADILINGGTLRTYVPGAADGRFVLAAGKTLTATNDAQLEFDQAFVRNGTTWMIESGSDLIANGLLIGFGSSGELTIRNGGRVNSTSPSVNVLRVGDLAGTTGTLNIDGGGALDIAGDIHVASVGGATTTGTINVSGGGTFTQSGAAQFTVGHASEGAGTININNGGTATTGTGAITFDATGVLNINGGPNPGDTSGVFTANGPMTVTGQVHVPMFDGVVTDPGGVLEVNAGLTIDGGTVSIFKGVIDADTISLTSGGAFDFTGGTLSVGQFNGNLVNQGGTLAPGSSAGGTTIVGNYTQQTGAALEIEIGGTLPVTEHDFVSITGTALLGGDLELALVEGFTPNAVDIFTVLSAGNLAGFFDNVASGGRLDTLDGGGSFEVTLDFSGDQIVLSDFQTAFTADFDRDGDVDGGDLAQWEGDFGLSANSDADSDGDSDGADFLAWQRQFGSAVSLLATSQPVPEPTTTLLALVGAIVCIHTRWWIS